MSENEASSLQPHQPEPDKSLARLTEQNWLFINAFLQTGNIQKSYKLAGYKGKDYSAPYQLFKQLKSRIEELSDLDVTSRARLQADIKSAMDIPLRESDKLALSLKDWLAVRKFVADITPEAKQEKPKISVLVINKSSDKQIKDVVAQEIRDEDVAS
jgi:hypothetical protein